MLDEKTKVDNISEVISDAIETIKNNLEDLKSYVLIASILPLNG